jgi:hypothetical protein
MKRSFAVPGLPGRWCFRLAVTALLLGSASVSAQAPLPNNSPFLPGGAAAPAHAPGETLELAGISVVGNRTDLIIQDKTTKKTSWVRLGATANGISALKYDPRTEQAVVRVNGAEKVLTLRKGTGPLNAPMPPAPVVVAAPAPANAAAPVNGSVQILPAPQPAGPGVPTANAVPGAPPTPDTVAKQETEARMLVSDLLEIGMAQRKAYEEAQRKMAAEQNATVQPGAPGQPPLPVPQAPADQTAPPPPPPQN